MNAHLSLSSLRLESIGEDPNIPLNRSLVPQELHIGTINPDLAFLTLLLILVTAERSEAPVLGDDDLLAAGELVLGATESFDGGGAVCRTNVSAKLFTYGGEAGRRTVVTSSH